MTGRQGSIRVALATVWAGPDASGPRDVLTQALAGERVVVADDRGDWLEVRLPWQPGPDGEGYAGFVRAGVVGEAAPAPFPSESGEPLALARRFLGTPYLWGGLSADGIDCSGLVHLSHRLAGLVVPRDAADQHAAAVPVEEAVARPGDLYFFARGGGRVTHVGYVAAGPVAERWMLHAPESGSRVEEGPMSASRAADLVGVGRFVRDATATT